MGDGWIVLGIVAARMREVGIVGAGVGAARLGAAQRGVGLDVADGEQVAVFHAGDRVRLMRSARHSQPIVRSPFAIGHRQAGAELVDGRRQAVAVAHHAHCRPTSCSGCGCVPDSRPAIGPGTSRGPASQFDGVSRRGGRCPSRRTIPGSIRNRPIVLLRRVRRDYRTRVPRAVSSTRACSRHHAGAGAFAGRIQAGDARASFQVGADVAHAVVCGGRDRNRLLAPVEAERTRIGVDGREPVT